MVKEKESKNKVSLLGFDPVETPEEVINTDTNTDRKEAFREAYKKVMKIIPEYFLTQRKKRKGTGASGGFAQNIVITPENVKVETTEVQKVEEQKETEREDRERE